MPADADIAIGFYLGASQTRASDLHVVQPDRGNDATMRKLPWPGYSFRFEPYYGFRLTYTDATHPQTKFVLDFTHYKIYGKTEDVIDQDGTWHGTAFRATAPASARVQSFEMTHGLNMLGVSVLQQLSGSSEGPYIGGGPVIYVPHSENRVDGIAGGDRFDFGGFGFQLHAGVRECVGDRPLFLELKYNEGKPTVTVAEGWAQTTLSTVHELAGLEFDRCAAGLAGRA
jgi:hypothetical protein